MVHIDPEILEKTGAELFKELFRVYPVAEVEDYFRMGAWRDDLIRTDLQLIYAHARESGAPYPPPLEECKFPELPVSKPVLTAGAALRVPGSVRPTLLKAPGAAPGAMPGAASAAAQGPAAELRLIALFVAKWKLDASRTKMALARLTAPKRRYVIQNFKAPVPAADDVTAELDTFIQECEKTDSWASAAAAKATGVAPTPLKATAAEPKSTTAAPTGLKRPLATAAPVGAVDPAKRPKMMGPGPATGAAPKPGGPGAAPKMGQPVPAGIRPVGLTRPPNMANRTIRPAAGAIRPTLGVRPPQAATVGKQ